MSETPLYLTERFRNDYRVGSAFVDYIRSLSEALNNQHKNTPYFKIDIKEDILSGTPETILKNSWNQVGVGWLLHVSPYIYAATMETLVQDISLPSSGAAKFLSVGSGPGLYENFLGILLQRNPATSRSTIEAVDFAKEMTRFHKESVALSKIKNVNPKTMDMTKLQYRPNQFDSVISINSLQWVPNWKRAIYSMSRVLKAGGHLQMFFNDSPQFNVLDLETKEPTNVIPDLGKFSILHVLDELESQRIKIDHLFILNFNSGYGQGENAGLRMYVKGVKSDQTIDSWRIRHPKIIEISIRG